MILLTLFRFLCYYSYMNNNVEKLREKMRGAHVAAYVVPSDDYHQSEYVGDYFKAREFITGFTGSAGTAVITADKAMLWTDGRYWLQAQMQLSDSEFELMKAGEAGVPSIKEWLADNLHAGDVIGFDGRVFSLSEGLEFEDVLFSKGIAINYSLDLVGEIWNDRPSLSTKPAFSLDDKYTGENTSHKLERIRWEMAKHHADSHIVASLDDICWILNIRGGDIEYSPLILSYLIIDNDGACLFVDKSKLSDAIISIFAANNISLREYDEIYGAVNSLRGRVLIDPKRLNYYLYKIIPKECELVRQSNPSVLMKSQKNPMELNNIREAHIKDGVAVTKFIYWVKNCFDCESINELSASEYLHSLRAEQEGFIQDSFEPIMAYGEHAAIIHYASSNESNVEFEAGKLLLFDTGGGYYQGSTDITRTIALGEVDNELKHCFTAVLKGMINLARAKFLYGTAGYNLDVLARMPIWNIGKDYKHGTGHGVGYLMNVHEAPCNINWKVRTGEHPVLEDGMIVTDEPGIYEDGKFGIRLENELLVRKDELTDNGQFMSFETITFAPIDLDAVLVDELTGEEKMWLNNYHRLVYEKLSLHLTEEESEWLREYTREI